MNSLEFIDKEIEFLEDMISIDLSLVEDDFDLQEIYKKQQKLRLLKQIKIELEAWYIVKKHLNRGEYVGLKNFFRFDLDKYNTLEKALEVKDD